MASILLAIIYLCFISLGLPDSLLGSAWPTIYTQLDLPVSYMAYIAMTISAGTIISSLLSDGLSHKIGDGLLTAISILLTAVGLLSFSFANQYWQFFLCAIPYGLGAGGVDAALNNYVALHYKAKHMSWLHCMWGIGAFVSPNIMAFGLTHRGWHQGYFIVFVIQAIISLVVFLSLPLWKKAQQVPDNRKTDEPTPKHLGVFGVFKLPCALLVFFAFFAYCSIENVCFQWSASYLVIVKGVSEELAANSVSFLYLGMALGRLTSGFLTVKFSDLTLIRIGEAIIFASLMGIIFIPNSIASVICLGILGFGAGPIYPSIVHSTPQMFGKENSQAVIGIQMAFAYVAGLGIPPLFGLFADHVGVWVFPFFAAFFLVLTILLYEIAVIVKKKTPQNN